ncbi:hypothetical protein C2845_PM05G26270 [Panicum miliaceum]|uniref:Uncharacterized protein n=1 Tax=Panicum miliaceum TaxID=4540 RepID=A0A3L6SYV6_PANMI|nr:hypothetical protein C2845_PM05G26270 [Panicum miliaceum]
MDIPPAQEQAAVQNNQSIDVDMGDEVVRTEKRILWSQAEDVRLVSLSAKIKHDPTVGADRKNEQYWDAVIETYNETTPSERRRNVYSLEDFIAEDDKLAEIGRKIGDKLKARIEGQSSEPPRRR